MVGKCEVDNCHIDSLALTSRGPGPKELSPSKCTPEPQPAVTPFRDSDLDLESQPDSIRE